MRRELDVVTGAALRLAVRALVGLVRRLVLREPQVVVGPEHVERAVLVERFGQFGHRRLDVVDETLLVLGPEGLGVVGFELLVELDRLDGKSA